MRPEELFPELAGRPARRVEAGWDSVVFDVDDSWIVRVPRRPEVEALARVEARLLPEISTALPAPVPEIGLVREAPFAIAYPKLRGAPLAAATTTESIGGALGRFLGALHGFSLDRARALGVRDAWVKDRRERAQSFLEHGVCLLRRDEQERAAALLRVWCGDAEAPYRPVLVHGDLGREHVLVEHGRLTGVLDWTDARIGDAAIDFAWMLATFSRDAAAAALDAYGRDDPELHRRADVHWRVAPWYDVLLGDREAGLAGVRAHLS